VPITRRYRRRRRHAALMLTVGKGHSLNRNISGKMIHSSYCLVFTPYYLY